MKEECEDGFVLTNGYREIASSSWSCVVSVLVL